MWRSLPRCMASTRKPTLKPGFGLGDWLTLQKATTAKGDPKAVITPEELSQHTSRYDCWMAIDGKVYNITQYVPYHPGGEDVLLKGAGKDCSVLFKKFHAWVNVESLLSRQLVGLLGGPTPLNAKAKAETGKVQGDKAELSVFKTIEDPLQAAATKLLEETNPDK